MYAIRKAALLASLTLSSACGASLRPVPPGAALSVTPEKAIVALGLDSESYISSAELRRQEDGVTALFLGTPPPGASLQIFEAPPGAYCLTNVKTAGITYQFEISDASECAQVQAGEVNYVGHLLIRKIAGQNRFIFANVPTAFCEDVASLYPELLEKLPERLDCDRGIAGER